MTTFHICICEHISHLCLSSNLRKMFRLTLVLALTIGSYSMRRGSRMNPPPSYPRDPSRCWKVSIIFPLSLLGSVCNDPNCEITPCPKRLPIDPKTGKRIKYKPSQKGLHEVFKLYDELTLWNFEYKNALTTSHKMKPISVNYILYSLILFMSAIMIPVLFTCLFYLAHKLIIAVRR